MQIEEIREMIKSKSKDLLFDEPTHKYSHVSEEVKFTSVTTVTGLLKPKFDAITQSERLTEKAGSKYFGIPPEEIREQWRIGNETAQKKGTAFHNYIEYDLRSLLTHSRQTLAERDFWRNSADFPHSLSFGYENFFNDCISGNLQRPTINRLQVVDLECRVFSLKWRLAGTFDALFLMELSNGDNIILVYDWKTNKRKEDKHGTQFDFSKYKCENPFNHYSKDDLTIYTFQTYIYKYILETEYNLPIFDVRVVWFNEDLNKGYRIYRPKFQYDRSEIERLLYLNLEQNG